MTTEIERKFLVCNSDWKPLEQGVPIRQGYLSSHPDRPVRVRMEGSSATLTIKGRTVGVSRGGWEYPIPVEDAQKFLDNPCEQPIIEKTRYRIPYQGLVGKSMNSRAITPDLCWRKSS